MRVQDRILARIDVAIAVVVVVVGVVELLAEHIQPSSVAIPMAVIAGASLAFRRRWPLVVVAVCFGALAVDVWSGVPLSEPATPIAWIVLSQYTVARHCALRRAILGLAIGLVIFFSTLLKDSSDLVFGLIVILAPWLVGIAMRTRVTETLELATRAETLEQQREDDIKAAAAAERHRIAQDLHDVIAHSVSVMVVQAGAAAAAVDRDPQRATAALQNVQDTGRLALTEMGALLGILRENGEEVGLAPQPGLDDLAALLDQTRTAGVPVELRVTGAPRLLPAGIQLSIYRVVQESLTNVRKHAGEGAQAIVAIDYKPAELRLEICDDGTSETTGYGGRHGIVGMTERVTIYGGTLQAGPAPESGFAVRARIPLDSA